MIYRHRPKFYLAFKKAIGRRPQARYPRLAAWARRILPLVDAVYAAADAQGVDEPARRALRLRADRRDVSMETILAALRYHAAREYPYLLAHEEAHNLTTIYAINLNDRYLVLRLSQTEAAQTEPLRTALARLRDHLDNAPSEQAD